MAILCEHLLLNRQTNIIPVSVAISDRVGLIDFSSMNDSVSYTYQKSSAFYGNKNLNIKVFMLSLDVLINDFNFPVPHVLKIDVEGAEYDVLKGGSGLIMHHRPAILLSTHEPHLKGVEENCLAFLQEQGYFCKRLPNEPDRFPGLNDYWCTPI
jgi:FkbM family methyltransferase